MNNFYLYLGIFLFVDFLLLAFVLYRNSKKKFRQADLNFFGQQWGKIHRLEDGKHALLEADKLLQLVLKKKGYAGNVGDQLKRAAKLFSNINDVWYAHKLRNRIAHELDMKLFPGDRTKAMRCFEKALQDLGAI